MSNTNKPITNSIIKLSVYVTDKTVYGSGCYRTSNGYMYGCYSETFINVYVDTNILFKSAYNIILSYIEKSKSSYSDKSPYREDNSTITRYSSHMTKELSKLLIQGVDEIDVVDEIEDISDASLFLVEKDKIDLVEDQYSKYGKLKIALLEEKKILGSEYERICKDAKTEFEQNNITVEKQFLIEIINATRDCNLNNKNPMLGGMYPLDIAILHEDKELMNSLINRKATVMEYGLNSVLRWLCIYGSEKEVSYFYECYKNDFTENIIALLMREAILIKNYSLLSFLSHKIDLNKLYKTNKRDLISSYKQNLYDKLLKDDIQYFKKIIKIFKDSPENWNKYASYSEDWQTGRIFNAISLACISKDIKALDILAKAGANILERNKIETLCGDSHFLSYFNLAFNNYYIGISGKNTAQKDEFACYFSDKGFVYIDKINVSYGSDYLLEDIAKNKCQLFLTKILTVSFLEQNYNHLGYIIWVTLHYKLFNVIEHLSEYVDKLDVDLSKFSYLDISSYTKIIISTKNEKLIKGIFTDSFFSKYENSKTSVFKELIKYKLFDFAEYLLGVYPNCINDSKNIKFDYYVIGYSIENITNNRLEEKKSYNAEDYIEIADFLNKHSYVDDFKIANNILYRLIEVKNKALAEDIIIRSLNNNKEIEIENMLLLIYNLSKYGDVDIVSKITSYVLKKCKSNKDIVKLIDILCGYGTNYYDSQTYRTSDYCEVFYNRYSLLINNIIELEVSASNYFDYLIHVKRNNIIPSKLVEIADIWLKKNDYSFFDVEDNSLKAQEVFDMIEEFNFTNKKDKDIIISLCLKSKTLLDEPYNFFFNFPKFKNDIPRNRNSVPYKFTSIAKKLLSKVDNVRYTEKDVCRNAQRIINELDLFPFLSSDDKDIYVKLCLKCNGVIMPSKSEKKNSSTAYRDTEDWDYSQSELDDMYRDAFDGNGDAYWNID